LRETALVVRGEVWNVSFDPTPGAEIRELRPAVIVSSDAVGMLPLRVVVPFAAWRPDFGDAPWLVRVDGTAQNGLSKTSAADAFQVKSLSVQRFVRRLGALSPADVEAIVRAIGTVIEHP
jgi:mRNA interferase MazF